MKITTTKTTATATTVTLKSVLTDDNGKQFATITGTVDNFHPLGTATFAVSNRATYAENADAAAEAYAAFQAVVAEIDAANATTSENVELLEDEATEEESTEDEEEEEG